MAFESNQPWAVDVHQIPNTEPPCTAWPEVSEDMAGLGKVMAKEAHVGEDDNPGQPVEALRIQMDRNNLHQFSLVRGVGIILVTAIVTPKPKPNNLHPPSKRHMSEQQVGQNHDFLQMCTECPAGSRLLNRNEDAPVPNCSEKLRLRMENRPW